MGICTSVRSDKKRRNRDVTANQLPNKNNTFVTNNEITSTRPMNNNQREKIIGKIDDKNLKRNYTVTSSNNKRLNNHSNIKYSHPPSLNIENYLKDKNQISFRDKKSEIEFKEKKEKIQEQNIPLSKEENTIASLKMEEEIKSHNINNIDNNNTPEQSNKSLNNIKEKKKEKEILLKYIFFYFVFL